MHCHRKDPVLDGRRADTVRERMEAAKAKDKSYSSALNAMKERLRTKVRAAVAISTFPSDHMRLIICALSQQ
jgi:hypothetical protein